MRLKYLMWQTRVLLDSTDEKDSEKHKGILHQVQKKFEITAMERY